MPPRVWRSAPRLAAGPAVGPLLLGADATVGADQGFPHLGVDVGLHDGIAPGGCHDQIHRSAKAVGELFFEPEVGIDKLGGFERLELHQQVDVALTWAVIGAQQRTEHIEP